MSFTPYSYIITQKWPKLKFFYKNKTYSKKYNNYDFVQLYGIIVV